MSTPTSLKRLMITKTIPLVVVGVFLLVQIVWVSLSPASVQAAPTISTATNGTMSASLNPSGTKSVSFNAGSGTGRVLVVVVASDDRTNKMNSVTYSGVAMTQAYSTGRLAPSSATARVQMFYLVNPDPGSNNVSFTASAADNYAYVIAYVSNADTASVGTVNSNSGTGSTLSVTNIPQESNSLIVTAFGSDSTTAFTPSGGSTEVTSGEVSATGIRAGMYTKAGGSAGVSVSTAASGGSAGWGAISLEIKTPVALPTLSVVAQDDQAIEPGDSSPGNEGLFVFMRTGTNDETALDVNFFRDGSAVWNTDYRFGAESTCEDITGDSLTIPAGETSCSLIIMPEYDEETETEETAEIQLDDSSSYQIGEDGTRGTVYITDTPPGGGGGTAGPCSEWWCPYVDYTIGSPGYASMYVYDDDTVPSGAIGTPLSATPTRVRAGGVSTLSWTVSGMTSCSIDNGIGAVDAADGTHTATTPAISTRTTFTLSCSDGTATTISRVSVGIVPSFIEQ